MINGNMACGKTLLLDVLTKNNNKYNGDIFYDTLSIDEGAVVEGQLRRRDEQSGKVQSKVSTVTPIGGDSSKKDSTEVKVS